jgi:hypothetical protein
VIEPSSRCVGPVDGKELDDEEVITHPTRPAHEAVVLQSNTRISLAIILDDVVGCTKMPREACIVHVAPECFRSWPLRAKTVSFPIVAPTVTHIECTVLSACPFTPPPPTSLTVCRRLGVRSGGPTGDRTGLVAVKTRFPPRGTALNPLSAVLRMAQAQDRNISLPLK